jgi:hypothetical protein
MPTSDDLPMQGKVVIERDRWCSYPCQHPLFKNADGTSRRACRQPIVQAVNGHAPWSWDGNRDAPTLTPSIDCKGTFFDGTKDVPCGWHGFIRGGKVA